MNYLLSLDGALEKVGDNYPRKALIEELGIIRDQHEDRDAFLTREPTDRSYRLGTDDAVGLHRYVELRNAGYPVKLAGRLATQLRNAMREHPEADQLVTVKLENGFEFTLPADTVDIRSGVNSGGRVVSATIFDCRNARERILRAIEAYEPEAEVHAV
jgi:hypothetical protein